MKEKIYIITCPDCSNDLFEGNIPECKSFVKSEYLDWSYIEWDNEEDGILELHCNDCQRMLS